MDILSLSIRAKQWKVYNWITTSKKNFYLNFFLKAIFVAFRETSKIGCDIIKTLPSST